MTARLSPLAELSIKTVLARMFDRFINSFPSDEINTSKQQNILIISAKYLHPCHFIAPPLAVKKAANITVKALLDPQDLLSNTVIFIKVL